MSDSLVPKRSLFRFSTSCLRQEMLWTARGTNLDARYRLIGLAELEGEPPWGDVYAAWNDSGLALSVRVHGKQKALWCRTTRPEDSDGVHVWLDTRDVHNVHRATRFCHRFLFMPTGGGRRADRPVAQWLPIHRSRGQPQAIKPDSLKVQCIRQDDGYRLDAFIAADALTGFDPAEHPRLGFNYAVVDRELGVQTFGPGSPMPYDEDPSLWATLELVTG